MRLRDLALHLDNLDASRMPAREKTMSDYGRINSTDLDRYITGNYGEDSVSKGMPTLRNLISCYWLAALREQATRRMHEARTERNNQVPAFEGGSAATSAMC